MTMPMRLDIKRKLVQRSDRVKGVEIHPTEPWILTNLYSGNVVIWDYETNSLVKSFEVTELPVRSSKWIARKQWIVAGSDDMFIRVYNYNTSELVVGFEAHQDYIRSIAVHPTQPYIVTCSDDMLIKLWDWERQWDCAMVFEGHSHYVMHVVFNPKDTNTFASASLDRTVKVWNVTSPVCNFTLEGHEKGVNCVDYFNGGDRPYLISGADDKLAKIWDYQTKSCVQTLEGHAHNVSAVSFHPELPVIITGSEDGTLRIWHQSTYRLENTLNYGLERVWAIGCLKGSNSVAIGYDEGTVMFKIGRDEPVVSMDNTGKIIWCKHNEVQTTNVKALPVEYEIVDGERLPLPVKELGNSELYPQSLSHNPNGRFVTVCGDGEYIIYTALAWRNKSFGSAIEFCWSLDPSEYAVRESSSKIKVFKNFTEKNSFRPNFTAEGLYGGALLGLRSTDFICFYDWDECRVIRRLDVSVRNVIWSESGEMVTIVSDTSFFILRYNLEATAEAFASGQVDESEGIEESFELIAEVNETAVTGIWVGDCFIYTNVDKRLNYCVGGEVTTLTHLDRSMFILGYLAAQNRVFLMDKNYGIVSFTLLLTVVEFKTLVLRGELEAAEEVLESIPVDQHNSIARFLESRGLVSDALRIATDPDFKFELAVQLGELDIAREIVESQGASESKWKQLGELAMSNGDLDLTNKCLEKSGDLSGQLLLATSSGSVDKLNQLVKESMAKGKNNVAFVSMFMLKNVDGCVDLLIETKRIPEAALFARTYAPSRVTEIIALWKEELSKINKKAAEALADPMVSAELFEGFEEALSAEARARASAGDFPEACSYGVGLAVDNLTAAVDNVKVGDEAIDEELVEAFVEESTEAVEEPELAPETEPEPVVEAEPTSEPTQEPTQEPTPEAEPEAEEPTEEEVSEAAEEGADEDWGLGDDESPAKAD